MIFDLEAQKSRRVIDQYGAQLWPAWSPDGRSIAYTSVHCLADCGRIIQELWVTDPGGGYARQILLANALCQQPVWSPDGKKIAFSSDMRGNYDIWALSLETWKLEQVAHEESLDVKPAWSPDGKRIAFISNRSGKMEIWIKDLERGKLKKLTPFGDNDVACKDVAW